MVLQLSLQQTSKNLEEDRKLIDFSMVHNAKHQKLKLASTHQIRVINKNAAIVIHTGINVLHA
ncbi:hypothetical protein BDZ91DRAFT_735704 [Kalaharituber pfeilii]|nr:hypothetical protein BDZ91DRAFT_735704 [Kalaharituber pfeilii]